MACKRFVGSIPIASTTTTDDRRPTTDERASDRLSKIDRPAPPRLVMATSLVLAARGAAKSSSGNWRHRR
jgi:hypothetical protein